MTETLAEQAIPVPDWTVDPASGRSNASPEFEALVAEVGRLIRGGAGVCLASDWVAATARLVMAQLAHAHGLSPQAAALRCCVCWLTREEAAPAMVIVNGLSACAQHAAHCQGGALAEVLRLLQERQAASAQEP